MKIFIIDIDNKFRPEHHETYFGLRETLGPYSIEEQFYNWIINSNLITSNKEEADFYYLPIFWYKYRNSINYKELDNLIKDIDISKIIIINTLELEQIRWNKLKQMIVFSGGFIHNKWKNVINIPLLHYNLLENNNLDKKYKMSFIGKWTSSYVRYKSLLHLNKNKHIYLSGYHKEWDRILSQSYISYCPSGYYPNTIRFWESLQLGVVPLVYSEYDFRPFKEFIKWNEFSFYTNDIEKIKEYLKIDNSILLDMGKKGKEFFFKKIWDSQWSNYVIKHLHQL